LTVCVSCHCGPVWQTVVAYVVYRM